MNSLTKKISWLAAFSIAMGFMEAAVVIYLRRIYYPSGFDFPLIPVEPCIAVVEFLREAATIIMLAGIGILVGRSSSEKFAFFLFCFAIWDLFYYVFLKVFLGWPESFNTWDILFLIPVPWVGPVLAPCILSLTMILFSVLVIFTNEKRKQHTIQRKEWAFFIGGSLVTIASFITPYSDHLANSKLSLWTPTSKEALFNEMAHFIPHDYNWWIFSTGELLILAGTSLFYKRAIKNATL